MRAPAWMPDQVVQSDELKGSEWVEEEGGKSLRALGTARKAEEGRGGGHAVVLMGPIAFCTRCARFAKDRLGVGLKGSCTAPQAKTANAVAARLRRMRGGRHPVTGAVLDLRG